MKDRVKATPTEVFCKLSGYPSDERIAQGPVAIIECEQEIPCNPCETSCAKGAIYVGQPITNLPILYGDKCIGCGLCVANCPGQAIFMLDATYSDTTALVGIPYEYVPMPEVGDTVDVRSRDVETLGEGVIRKIINNKATDKTNVVFIEVDKKLGKEVRAIGIK